VNPSELKGTAIGCALLATAAWQWNARPANEAAGPSERSGWRGGLTLFAVSVLLLVSLLAFTAEAGWSRDRVIWVGLGTFLALMR
jgi:hypothetical protein